METLHPTPAAEAVQGWVGAGSVRHDALGAQEEREARDWDEEVWVLLFPEQPAAANQNSQVCRSPGSNLTAQQWFTPSVVHQAWRLQGVQQTWPYACS